MCLSKLWSKKTLRREQARGPIKAYKVVRIHSWSGYRKDGRLYPPMMSRGVYRTNYQWNVVRSDRIITMGWEPRRRRRQCYPAGFHAYAKLDTAYANCCHDQRVIPCLLNDIVAVGKQNGGKVYVARKMMLLT